MTFNVVYYLLVDRCQPFYLSLFIT